MSILHHPPKTGGTEWLNCSGKDSTNVPFLLESLQLDFQSWDLENGNRSEAYKICLSLFRHACEVHDVRLTGVFTSLGRLVRGVERDIRLPLIPQPELEQLRGHKSRYIEIVVRILDNDPNL